MQFLNNLYELADYYKIKYRADNYNSVFTWVNEYFEDRSFGFQADDKQIILSNDSGDTWILPFPIIAGKLDEIIQGVEDEEENSSSDGGWDDDSRESDSQERGIWDSDSHDYDSDYDDDNSSSDGGWDDDSRDY